MLVDITLRDMAASPALDATIRDHADRLDRVHPGISRCEVLVESPHRHQRQGRPFHVRIELTTTSGALVVSRAGHHDDRHEDAHVAVRDAFDVARRQLAEHVERRRGDIKHHGEHA